MADGNLTGIRRRDRRRTTVVVAAAAVDTTIGDPADTETGSTTSALTYFDDYGGGSPQSFDGTLTALLPNGGSEPTMVLTAPGTYLLIAQLQVEASGATVTTESITFELYRQNNTPGSIAHSTLAIALPVMTAATMTIGVYPLPPVFYTTTADDDEIVIAGVISAGLSAGTIDASGAAIVAIKIA